MLMVVVLVLVFLLITCQNLILVFHLTLQPKAVLKVQIMKVNLLSPPWYLGPEAYDLIN